ncbi:MAG TPA: FkbM family methyltransferase [Gemmataceae bacterium]|jgi:FkbM family methyltransferase|nr:FkbM family methyltransferase [Gemmataceae bacterium]
MLKKIASRFPAGWQQELKRHYYAWQLRRGKFRTAEKEFELLDSLVQPGDWVIDVGANIGHYTAKLSQLVGPGGRVLAFEPVPKTFRLLAANSCHFPYENVSFLNAAVSERAMAGDITVPDGLNGTYLAHLTKGETGLQVLCLSLDSLQLPHRVSLVKIDAEGHELEVLKGMEELLRHDRPTLIVELGSGKPVEYLQHRGYHLVKLPGSPNGIFRLSVGQDSSLVAQIAGQYWNRISNEA